MKVPGAFNLEKKEFKFEPTMIQISAGIIVHVRNCTREFGDCF